MKSIYIILAALFILIAADTKAGNPDRQGEAGAYELLMNPWARSSGFHTISTARIRGVEALRLNPAGLSGLNKTEILFARSNYLSGTGVSLNAFGLGQRLGEKGVLGISLMSIDFGDIEITTTELPEGTGSSYSPSFFNLGIAYCHQFSSSISVGTTMRLVSETTSNVSAQGFAIDAGIQYTTGPADNIRFGISLRNVGTPMRFSGEGLSFVGQSPSENYTMTLDQRSATYELPSALNIGGAYDFILNEQNTITALVNFNSNSFSRDLLGAGFEYSFKGMFAVRAGYKYELDSNTTDPQSVYTGLSAGASLNVPIQKKEDGKASSKFGIDYSYRASNPFGGTHTIGVRINL